MGMRELLIGAIALGGAAGLAATSLLTSVPTYGPQPTAEAKARKTAKSPALVDVPQTEEQSAADSAWSAGQSQSVAQARFAAERDACSQGNTAEVEGNSAACDH